jgi:hypothetical protein
MIDTANDDPSELMQFLNCDVAFEHVGLCDLFSNLHFIG